MKFSLRILLLLVAVAAVVVAVVVSNLTNQPWGQLTGKFVDGNGKGIENVWVVLTTKDVSALRVHKSLAAQKENPVVVSIDQNGCSHRFVHVQTGQTLRIVNNDTRGRNVCPVLLNWAGSSNIPLGGSQDFVFEIPCRFPGYLADDLTAGFIIPLSVTDHPYATSTNANGEFSLPYLPKGNWEFRFWHPEVGHLRNVKIGAEMTGRRGDIEIDVRGFFKTDLGTIEVEDSKFVR